MSEIICPFCGSANAIDARSCKTCKRPLYEDADSGPAFVPSDDMDWLDDLRDEREGSTFTGSKGEHPQTPAELEPEIPEWLARIRARKSEETPSIDESPASTEPPILEADQNAELPQWIRDIKQGSRKQPVEEKIEPLPDWLDNLSAGGKTPSGKEPTTVPSEIPPESSSDQPMEPLSMLGDEGLTGLDDGLENLTEEANQYIPPEVPSDIDLPGETSTVDANIPALDKDWLDQRFESQIPRIEDSTPVNEQPDWLPSLESEEPQPPLPAGDETGGEKAQLPEWMVEPLDTEKLQEEPAGELDLRSIAGSALTGGEEEPVNPLPEEGLPEWLFEEQTPPAAPAMDYTQPGPADLEKGQLPGWLNAMRPVEAAVPELPSTYDENRIEANGPLAGYQGVLPGEGLVTHYNKPPVYTERVQVTDKQRIYATLFDTLIADEQKIGAPAEVISTRPQLIARFVLGILLSIVILALLFFQPGLAGFPNLVPPEAVEFYKTVQSLSDPAASHRILVGMDYDPSLSGEMRAISTSVLETLMNGNAGLALVTINPAGPVLGSELVTAAAGNVPDYSTAEQVVNLGYLPGGSSALALFAANPALGAVTTFDGTAAWDGPVLQGVKSVSDFDAILLLTDNIEHARTWIEQIMPFAGAAPLIVASSAQAAPALQPYVQSGQISGMIAGLSGGAAYEQLMQKSNGPIRTYWDAYQGGLLLIALFILVGTAFFGIKNILRADKKAG